MQIGIVMLGRKPRSGNIFIVRDYKVTRDNIGSRRLAKLGDFSWFFSRSVSLFFTTYVYIVEISVYVYRKTSNGSEKLSPSSSRGRSGYASHIISYFLT